jgi:multidrug efflux pump subunit AcrA (membrane-fusion protein)
MEPFSEDLSLLAEKIGELQARLAVVTEREGLAAASLEATAAAQQASLTALQAAMAGVVALDEANPGVAAKREIRALSALVSDSVTALSGRLAAVDSATKELARADSDTLTALNAGLAQARQDFAANVSQLTTALDALRQEFAARDRLNPCGCYVPGKSYNRMDLVELNGSSYISTEDNNTEKPSKRSKRWMLSAGRGGSMAIGGASPSTNVGGGLTIVAEDDDSITIET